LNTTKANIKNIENKIKKNLDIEMKEIVGFYSNFDLNKTKKEIDSNYGRFNLLLSQYTKLNYDNKKLAKLQSQIKNKNNYYISLIDNKNYLSIISKTLNSDKTYFDDSIDNHLTKENTDKLLNIKNHINKYKNKISFFKKNYEELAVGLLDYEIIINKINKNIDSRAKVFRGQINLIANKLEERVQRLINSKFVFNRDSKIEYCKLDVLYYKELDDKLKCLS